MEQVPNNEDTNKEELRVKQMAISLTKTMHRHYFTHITF